MSGGNPLLTAKGWPRPIVEGKPVPWISPKYELSQMNRTRARHVVRDARCQVCGIPHETGADVFLCISTEGTEYTEVPPDAVAVRAMDLAILHERCARLAVARCPVLARLRSISHLQVFKTRLEHVERHRHKLYVMLEHATRDMSFTP